MNAYAFSMPLDPSALCTAQQKKVSFRQHRIFTHPKVALTKRRVAALARPHRAAVRAFLSPDAPIALDATYRYAYPKGTSLKRRIDDVPRPIGADCDNLHKAVQDALGDDHGRGAGLWDDDRRITALLVRKRYTTDTPRIDICVRADG